MKTNRKIAIISAIVSGCIVIAFWNFIFGRDKIQEDNKQSTEIKISESLNYPQNDQKETVENATNIDFESLKEWNEDIYAWITIPGTDIDYPVVKKMDSNDPFDDYYLSHTVDHEDGFPGAIYSHPFSDVYFTDAVTILYGHNLRDGGMFTALHNFEDKDFFNENDTIIIHTQAGDLNYRIFAVSRFSDVFIPEEYDFSDLEEVERYLKDIKDSSINFRGDMEVAANDKVLTLSTCYTNQDAVRLLVVGILSEE